MTVQAGPLAGRMTRRAMQIRPKQAGVFDVKENQFLQISDMIGKQVAIMVAFNLHDHEEYLSTSHTRAINHSLMLMNDHSVYSNRRNKMFTIIADSVGRHDTLMPIDDERSYLDDYAIPDHTNSLDNFARGLKDHDIDRDGIPTNGINWFMNVGIKARGELEIREPLSTRNDNVALKAHMDLLVAICASPNEQSAMNGFKPTDILIRVYM